MSYLTLLGFLTILVLSVLALDNKLVHKDIGGALASNSSHQQKNGNSMSIVHGNVHKLNTQSQQSIFDGWRNRTASRKQMKLSRFERRVLRLLKKYGILKEDYTAEKVVESLRKDKDLLRELKKLLDEVDEENEPDYLFEALLELFG